MPPTFDRTTRILSVELLSSHYVIRLVEHNFRIMRAHTHTHTHTHTHHTYVYTHLHTVINNHAAARIVSHCHV